MSESKDKAEEKHGDKKGEILPRYMLTPENAIVIVHKKDGTYYPRAPPYTMAFPTEYQFKSRIEFGTLARKAKDKKWKGKYEMPLAALMVSGMKNYTFGRTTKLKKWERILLGID